MLHAFLTPITPRFRRCARKPVCRLQRQPVPGDRRKTALVLTEKAAPVIEQGRRLQKSFADRLTEGLRAEDLAHFRRCVAAFERNIERIRMENPKGTEM